MAKGKKRNKQRSQPQRPALQNTAEAASSSEKVELITKDDLASSTSQAEFEKNKEALLQQALDEIAEWDSTRTASETAAKEAQVALEKLEVKKKELEEQRNELQKQFDEIQDKYNNAEKKVKLY